MTSTGTTPAESRNGKVQRKKLGEALKREVRGEVRFGKGDRHLYATDSSNYRQFPLGVVLPLDTSDLARTLEICHRFHAPVTLRGGGTSLAGQTTNEAVVIDHSKYLHEFIEVDPERRLARVAPGVVLDRLQEEAAKHGLRFGPDPSTHNNCTIGGMLGNNACGVHSVASANAGLGARSSDNVARLKVLTADGIELDLGPTSDEEYASLAREEGRKGEIYRRLRRLRDEVAGLVREEFPDIPRRVSGYNLDELLPEHGFNLARAMVGTEGTCATIIEATLHLIPAFEHRALTVLGFEDVFLAGDAVPEVLRARPDALEGMDAVLMDLLKSQNVHPVGVGRFPPGHGWLLAEFAGTSAKEVGDRARELAEAFADRTTGTRVVTDPEEQESITLARESGLGVTAHVSDQEDAWEGWEDTAVAPERLGDYMRAFRALLDRHGYEGPFYGHFGQGLVHTRLTFDLKTGPGIKRYRDFTLEAAGLVKRFGGSLSGEHGDGQARGELLGILYSEEMLQAFQRFKEIWDPRGVMNPGKLVRANRLDRNLRMGSDYRPPLTRTFFRFPDDRNSFAYATERCVGVGNCRKLESGTMCPSYMATREEMHATRGRAHLLFELLGSAELSRKRWRDKTLKASLDLCLACKACKSECPVHVDMATYKAEFMAHYYAHSPRPRAAFSMGLIMLWARIASRLPRLANFCTQTKGLKEVSQWVAGLARERSLPTFARESFRHWFVHRPERRTEGPAVVLWPDTFNNYFTPGPARAAVEVLEHAGWRVELPPDGLCCGRPLYDFGMLGRARHLLLKTVDRLQPQLERGLAVVGLEPSCVSVFRDEARNLLPGDEGARRLARQCFTFAEFLQRHGAHAELPRIPRRALLHTHCHHDAILKTADDEALWDRLGLEWEHADTGCCGMAGSFGFEPEKYAVSRQIGEHRFLPALRAQEDGVLLIADGFSCREQARDLAGIRPRHLAEVIADALRSSSASP
jgi:FAD/FMN-containing dehydrogenase/Fe-S oxidoreductase